MTSKQLEDPKVQEKYVGLIQSYMYRQNSGGVVATGRPDLDRWLFNRYAGVRGPLLSIPTNIYIWNIICKSQLSPGKTLAMVASINVGQKLFFKYLHFLEQDKTIGQ